MPSLADILRSLPSYMSSLPGRLGRSVQSSVATGSGIQDPNDYDNPTPYFGATPQKQAEAGLSLAGMMQTGSIPFGPSGAGGTLGAIPVWHGSPHLFEKFDTGKIGTGEGNQAYGHGLYFAENPETAKSYIAPDSNSKVSNYFYKGKLITAKDELKHSAAYMLSYYKGNKDDAINLYSQKYYETPSGKKLKKLIESMDYSKLEPAGGFYKISLEHPFLELERTDPLSPGHFLNYDAPLSEQSQHVLNALGGERAHALLPSANIAPDDVLGKDLLRMLSQSGKKPIAEDLLRWQGIPGLRYLDAGSREAGGTSNYVVFDDRIPKIIERNGISLADLLKKR